MLVYPSQTWGQTWGGTMAGGLDVPRAAQSVGDLAASWAFRSADSSGLLAEKKADPKGVQKAVHWAACSV